MRRIAFLLALAAATALFLAPSVPSPEGVPLFDKAGHFAILAALALLGAHAYRERPRWTVVAGLILYAAAIEIVQPLTGRSADPWDVVAGAVGALAAFALPRRAAS